MHEADGPAGGADGSDGSGGPDAPGDASGTDRTDDASGTDRAGDADNTGDTGPAGGEWLTWRAAMARALYGPGGFFLREHPGAHFRTSVHASPLFAAAVAELLVRVDAALGRPRELAFADVGAGRGELCAGVLAALPAEVAARVAVHAVELAPRPPGLDPRIRWTPGPAALPRGLRGLLFANEWLDNVPLDAAERGPDGVPRYVEVRVADGAERLGAPLTAADARWVARWWPLGGEPGARAEVGTTREAAWREAVGALDAGLAVAVDYAHTREARPPRGTLTGYRGGRQVPPVPDGSCDLTAHVALDALGAVGTPVGGRPVTQRDALRALGVSGARPPLELAAGDPSGYVRALAAASQAAELVAPGGLGSFTWLLAPVGPACAGVLAPS